jgi:hypothetical protein
MSYSNKLSIRIDSPCKEKLSNMTSTKDGKYCFSCQKEVTDFTRFSNDEIFEWFKQNKTNVCGMLTQNQLNDFKATQIVRQNYLPRFIVAAMLGLGIISKSEAKYTSPNYLTEQYEGEDNLEEQNKNSDSIAIKFRGNDIVNKRVYFYSKNKIIHSDVINSKCRIFIKNEIINDIGEVTIYCNGYTKELIANQLYHNIQIDLLQKYTYQLNTNDTASNIVFLNYENKPLINCKVEITFSDSTNKNIEGTTDQNGKLKINLLTAMNDTSKVFINIQDNSYYYNMSFIGNLNKVEFKILSSFYHPIIFGYITFTEPYNDVIVNRKTSIWNRIFGTSINRTLETYRW